jgi:ATP-dependent protease HslVU (ClpYQ) peptidase subunit
MTTVAYDGKFMASDTLAVDYWGLKEVCNTKILCVGNFAVGCAGSSGQIEAWWQFLLKRYNDEPCFDDVMKYGYPSYKKDDDDPSLMLVCDGTIARHATGVFTICDRPFFAIGSGRDYALAAMHCGKSAREAVLVASVFDNNTNSILMEWSEATNKLSSPQPSIQNVPTNDHE